MKRKRRECERGRKERREEDGRPRKKRKEELLLVFFFFFLADPLKKKKIWIAALSSRVVYHVSIKKIPINILFTTIILFPIAYILNTIQLTGF
jgi:hypothetical protein